MIGRVHVASPFHTRVALVTRHKQLAQALARLGQAGAIETAHWIAAAVLAPRHKEDLIQTPERSPRLHTQHHSV